MCFTFCFECTFKTQVNLFCISLAFFSHLFKSFSAKYNQDSGVESLTAYTRGLQFKSCHRLLASAYSFRFDLGWSGKGQRKVNGRKWGKNNLTIENNFLRLWRSSHRQSDQSDGRRTLAQRVIGRGHFPFWPPLSFSLFVGTYQCDQILYCKVAQFLPKVAQKYSQKFLL